MQVRDSQSNAGSRAIPTVLLTNTTWWVCASRIALALTRAGCNVAALYPASGHPLAKTSVIRGRFKYSALNPMDSLEAAIKATRADLVIPCDDRAVEHLHALHARTGSAGTKGLEVRSCIERSLGSPVSYSTLSNRHKLLEAAREEGVLVPDSRIISTFDDVKVWVRDRPAPWVLKTDGSWGGHGVKIVDTLAQAEESLTEMSRPLDATRAIKRLLVNRDPFWLRNWLDHSVPIVTVQSYIPGHPANCAVACWNGEVLGGIAVEVVVAQGVTGSAAIVRVVEGQEMINAARLLARKLNLSGLFGLDFVIEKATGVPLLIELNPRCTPLCHLQLGPGRDMIEALRARLTGAPVAVTPPSVDNDLIAYFPQAWHWDSTSEIFKCAYHDVPSEEPALVEELLRLPWPDRSLFARVSDRIRHMTFADRRSKGGTFQVPETGQSSLKNSKRSASPDR